MKVVIVGEAWGKSEALMRHALVGASGRELSVQIGKSGLGPYMQLACRKCATVTDFRGHGFCPSCGEYRFPNEFDLIAYWKTLHQEHQIAVTNVFNERPPSQCKICSSFNVSEGSSYVCMNCRSRDIKVNDIGWFFGPDPETDWPRYVMAKIAGGHLKREHLYHLERFERELGELKPNLVVALGNTPCWALLGQTKISALRGTVNWSKRFDVKVIPTYHPAGILRAIENRVEAIADLTKCASEAEFPEIRRPERWITIPSPDEAGLHELQLWFRQKANTYAVDIETLRGQISFVSFALSPNNSISIPFRDAKSYNGRLVDVGKVAKFLGFESRINFWPDQSLELAAWRSVIAVCEDQRISKIFQNGLYDISYFTRMGIHVRNAEHDPMIWHHALYPEKPKSLGYLGSLFANDIPWKLMGKHQSLKRDE